MKNWIFFIVLSGMILNGHAQIHYNKDSLKVLLLKTKADTARVSMMAQLSSSYYNENTDSQYYYGKQGLKLAHSIGYYKGKIESKHSLSWYWWAVGDYATAITLQLSVLKYARAIKDTNLLMQIYGAIASTYRDQGDYNEALQYGFLGMELAKAPLWMHCFACGISSAVIGSIYYEVNQNDSALFLFNQSYALSAYHCLRMDLSNEWANAS